MIGAIIGDILGSKFECHPIKSKDFPFFSEDAYYTDDSLMTLAVGLALNAAIAAGKRADAVSLQETFTEQMQAIGRKYPHPRGPYGKSFYRWLFQEKPQAYNSWGNGSAMRVSACGELATSLDEALFLAQQSALVTHNHPEGIKGAEATAGAIYLAKTGESREEIQNFLYERFYPEHLNLEEIRASYHYDPSCQGTVPPSMAAFFEATSFADALRNSISLGGDADTMGAITGSVAWPYFARHGGITKEMKACAEEAIRRIPAEFRTFLRQYEMLLAAQMRN